MLCGPAVGQSAERVREQDIQFIGGTRKCAASLPRAWPDAINSGRPTPSSLGPVSACDQAEENIAAAARRPEYDAAQERRP